MDISLTAAPAVPPATTSVATWRYAIATLVAGCAIGIVTQILQGVLPDGWGVLANSGVMWAVMAFALGATLPTPRWAATGGAVALVVASITYYLAADWFEGSGANPRATLIWSVAGIVAGLVFGLAGHLAVHDDRRRPAALALVGGVLLGEGVHLVWLVGNRALRPAGLVELAIAAAITLTCLADSARAGRTARAGTAISTTAITTTAITGAVVVAAGAATLVAFRIIDGVFLAT